MFRAQSFETMCFLSGCGEEVAMRAVLGSYNLLYLLDRDCGSATAVPVSAETPLGVTLQDSLGWVSARTGSEAEL